MPRKRPENGTCDALRDILESISDGVFTVDAAWRVTSFNRAAEAITGVPRAEAIGKPCCEVFRASMCEADCALRRTLETGRPIVNRTAFIVNAQGRRIPISVSTALLRDAHGTVVGGAETFRDLSLVEELRKELAGRFQIGDFVSRSAAMRTIHDFLPQLAASDSTVLLLGETGTGKELLAKALHGLSRRSKGPFVGVNCGALPDSLLESELFGHHKGAFTGADRDRAGRFAQAAGGTLFLDEIGDVSPAMQVRLLRVLQERVFEPVGATRSVRADVRVIAATHSDLARKVSEGTFRQDLYYRINVVKLEVPPLRSRREDIPLLVDHFVERFNRRQAKHLTGVTPEVLSLLMAHDFPGNVRELENLIEHAFVLCERGRIEPRHLPVEFSGAKPTGFRTATRAPAADLPTTVRETEGAAIQAALDRCHGNRLAAARALGLHKSTLFRKIKRLGVALPATDGRASKSNP